MKLAPRPVQPSAVPAGISLLYADAALLVLDKPPGLLSVPGRGADRQDCLSARVQRLYPDALVVHRLDMATSGLMLLARGAAAQRTLSEAFAKRKVNKRYVAVVDGHLLADAEDWACIDLPIAVDWPRRPLRVVDPVHGKPSVTRWRVLSHDPVRASTRLELEPHTGRSHQLRVHLQALGHPILGDTLYGCDRTQALSERLLLHASTIELEHPLSRQSMRFDSPPGF